MRNLVIALSAVLGLLAVSLIADQQIFAGPSRPPVRGAVYGYCTAAGCSGTLLGPNGTSSLPTFSFISDPNTGMYLSSADVLGFSAGGGPRMTIDSSGIYGIPFYSSANGTAGAPRFSWQSDTDTGLYRSSDNVMGISGGADAKMTFGATINSDIPIDFEGYASIGNGSAVAATETLIVDRDFSTATTGSQLSTGGIITVTGGTSNIPVALIAPQGVVLNDGGPGVHPVVASLEVREPVITETVGTCTTSAVYYAPSVASECDNNYSFYSATGSNQFDGTLDIGATNRITDWVYANAVSTYSDTGDQLVSQYIGFAGEAAADASRVGIGIVGTAKTHTAKYGIGVMGRCVEVNATGDTGVCYGGYFQAAVTHAGGENIGAYFTASSGSANHAISIGAGDLEWNGKTRLYGDGTNGTLEQTVSDGTAGFCTSGAVDGIMTVYDNDCSTRGVVDTGSFRAFDASGNGAYFHEVPFSTESVSPGGSGATLTVLNVATLTWLLDATTEYLYFEYDVHSDWDAASDHIIQIEVILSAAETANDDIQAEVICEFCQEHQDCDTSIRTQTRSINHDIVSDNAQGKEHTLIFILDYDLASHSITVGDGIACRFRLDAVGGGTDVASVLFKDGHAEYRTNKPQIETGGSFPSEG